jgi:hypothetical protein
VLPISLLSASRLCDLATTQLRRDDHCAVADHDLMTSQRNEVFAAIQQAGLDPATFKWARVRSAILADLRVPRLVHVPSSSAYQFDLKNGKHWCRFSPGRETLTQSEYPGDWRQQIACVIQWLGYLKRETESPDLWAMISGEAALVLGAGAPGGADNAPFLPSESQRISASLGAIRDYLVATQHVSGARLAFAEERLRYLEEASTRIGRKDWINLAYGALINIVVGAALSPDAAKDLLRLAGSALAWVLGGTPILPTPAG